MSKLGLLDVEASVQKNAATEMFYEFAKNGSVVVQDFADFEEKLSDTLFSRLVKLVKNAYSFLPDTEVDVSKEELYCVYKNYN